MEKGKVGLNVIFSLTYSPSFGFVLKVLAIKTRELNSVQSDCSVKSSQLENKHAQELTAEREKSLQV